MWVCKKCNGENPNSTNICQGCGEKHMEKLESPQSPKSVTANVRSQKRRVSAESYDYKTKLVVCLEVLGWIVLALGIVSAIIVFASLDIGLLTICTAFGVLLGAVAGCACLKGLASVVWDAGTTKALIMQMYDKAMNDD